MFGFGGSGNFIECPEARNLVREQGAQLVDVRSPAEYAQGALPGSVNIPVQVIHQAGEAIMRDKPVIVYCVSGARSAQAKNMLEQLGFDDVHNMGPITKYLSCE